jgi:hypothetical protein
MIFKKTVDGRFPAHHPDFAGGRRGSTAKPGWAAGPASSPSTAWARTSPPSPSTAKTKPASCTTADKSAMWTGSRGSCAGTVRF